MSSALNKYYENYDEEGRLQRDNTHRIEFLTTVHYFDKLFNPNSRILDACAGTGAYSFYLAEKGHSVTACDLVPHNVNIIKRNPKKGILESINVCNVLDLSCYDSDMFDVVLCMGALYHLKSDEDRKTALLESKRVLKPGGILAFTYLNKFACVAANVNAGLTNIDEVLSIYHDKSDFIFTATTPEKMLILAKECKLDILHCIGTDGMAYVMSEKLNTAENDNFIKWMEYHLATCEEVSILGSSMHGLNICIKRA